MKTTVLFGGTFNPFHIGHYEMLSALCRRPEIERVLVIPDRIPPHKHCDYLAPDADRVKMCELAAEDFEKASVSKIELERAGKSYTIDTVSELMQAYPDVGFALACGGDMLATLDTWHRGKELIRMLPFYAFHRSDDKEFNGSVERLKKMGARITVIDKKITAVSSTELRRIIKSGEKPETIPEKIWDYIKGRGLYV